MKAASLTAMTLFAALYLSFAKAEEVVTKLDLTAPFHTASKWEFSVVTREDQELPEDNFPDGDNTKSFYALRKNDTADSWQGDMSGLEWHFDSVEVVQAGKTPPLLLISSHGIPGFNGNRNNSKALFYYDRDADTFRLAFSDGAPSNTNGSVRFLKDGPLAGDMAVVSAAGFQRGPRPFSYDLVLYEMKSCCSYSERLRYRTITQYNDGNGLAVLDAEMPEILRQLGVWHSGLPLPKPQFTHHGCAEIVLKKGIEWCSKWERSPR